MKDISKVVLATFLVSLSGCTKGDSLNGAGATFPYPIYSAWANEYSVVAKVKVNYQSIGSGGGIKQITERTVDFGASDKPLTPEELTKNKLLQFPAVIGGVVIVVNMDDIKPGELQLDSESLSLIYLGEIKKWNDPKLVALNPKLKLLDANITVVHRSDGSGTTSIFTDYLCGVSVAFKQRVGTGTSVSWPVGIGGKGNEGVSNYVKQAPNSIGFVEFAYAQQNNLAYTALKNRAGTFVQPSFDSFSEAAASGDFDPKKDFYLMLNDSPGANAWPIAGATFILLAKEKLESNKKVVKFYDWAFNNGDTKAKELSYVPLPKSLKEKIHGYWKSNGLE
jgi:phosphate transport system substrate-binding protein